MTAAAVPLRSAPASGAEARLCAALAARDGIKAVSPAAASGEGWVAFETPDGQAALRVVAANGLAQPPASPEDGAGVTAQIEAAEALIAACEAALRLAIVPDAVVPAPPGVAARVDDGAGNALILVLPGALADRLPPADALDGAGLYELRLPAPGRGGQTPRRGDLLLLGPAPLGEAAPRAVPDAPVFALRVTADERAPETAGLSAPAGGTIRLDITLTAREAQRLRDGAPMRLGEGSAPAARYTDETNCFEGHLVPFGAQVALRFD